MEEEQDKLDKGNVEMFKRLKTSSREEEGGQSSLQDVENHDLVHVQYETDEVEFEEDVQPSIGGPCHLYGGGAPNQQINTQARGQSCRSLDNDEARISSQVVGNEHSSPQEDV